MGVRYRFADFVLSPARRQLLRGGRDVPLIPRYFDLLVLLLERRGLAVHRRDIMDRVWSDVVVSDGALSQAVRTLRRTLGDDSREPVYIRTVSRHGYRFDFPGVVEEADGEPLGPAAIAPAVEQASAAPSASPASADAFETALERLLRPRAAGEDGEGDDRREAAETLHALGTAEALRRLDRRPGHEAARALLRDARFDVPGAGPVPLLGQPGGFRATALLFAMRLSRALRAAGLRWTGAAAGGALAGALAGLLGGVALRLAPGSQAAGTVVAVLGLVGAVVGGLGAAGVGAGLAVAEALIRSARGPALVLFGAMGGGLIGMLAHHLARWTLQGVFGQEVSVVGGGWEGLGLGAAAGFGYALATPRPGGGMAAPRGRARLRAAALTGLACAVAGVLLTWADANLTGVSLNALARSFQGSQVQLAPVARLLGEAELGPLTRTALGVYEGGLFGFGLALGFTRRPR